VCGVRVVRGRTVRVLRRDGAKDDADTRE
jgi:hypothetical protein